MNDRIVRALRALATDANDVRTRVAIAAEILSKIHPSEMTDNQREMITRVVSQAQRYPALKDQKGEVIRTSFEETARRGQRKKARETAILIWNLYQESQWASES